MQKPSEMGRPGHLTDTVAKLPGSLAESDIQLVIAFTTVYFADAIEQDVPGMPSVTQDTLRANVNDIVKIYDDEVGAVVNRFIQVPCEQSNVLEESFEAYNQGLQSFLDSIRLALGQS